MQKKKGINGLRLFKTCDITWQTVNEKEKKKKHLIAGILTRSKVLRYSLRHQPLRGA